MLAGSLTAFPSPRAGRPTLRRLERDFCKEVYKELRTASQTGALKRRRRADASGNTADTSAPPLFPCPSTRASAVSSHTRRQGGKHGVCLPARSLRDPQPQPGSIDPEPPASRLPTAPADGREKGEEKGRGRFWQLGAGCTNVQLLVGLWWFSLPCPAAAGAPGALPMQTMLPASNRRPAGGLTSKLRPGGEPGSTERRGSWGGREDVLGCEKLTGDGAGAAPRGTAQEGGTCLSRSFLPGKGRCQVVLSPCLSP